MLYDALVQQMEDTFQELHLLMLDLGITELLEEDKPAVKATGTLTGSTSIKRNGAAVDPGSVVFLPCKVRVDALNVTRYCFQGTIHLRTFCQAIRVSI